MHISMSPVTDQLKSHKTECSNSPQDLGQMKIQFWWSCVPLFLWCCRQTCYYFHTKFKLQFSAKDWCVDQRIQTAEAPCFGWSKWLCIVHSLSAFCFFFEGSVAEMKWSYMIRSHFIAAVPRPIVTMSVMWTSAFPVLFTTTGFVLYESGVQLFLHHWDTVCY